MRLRPPTSTLFPYTTLFRSRPMMDREYEQSQTQDEMMSHAEQVLSALPFIQAFGREDAERLNRSEEHTSELQSHSDLVRRLLLEKKKNNSAGHIRIRRKNRG